MTRTGRWIDVDRAVMDPDRFFSRPADVLDATALSRVQKRRILRSWAFDADRINEAESENMGGRPADRSVFREARLALLTLDG
jgi:hypothetical protein